MYKPKHISYSGLNKYLECPQKYAFAYIDGIYPQETPLSFVFGGAFHEGLAEYYKGNDWRKALMLSLWKEVGKNITRKDYDTMVRAGDAMMADFLVYGRKYKAKFVEKKFICQLKDPLSGEVLPIPVKGIMDLITEENEIVDHKTSSTKECKEYQEGMELQLTVYSLCYRSMFNKAPKKLSNQIFLKRITAGHTGYFDIEPDITKESVEFGKINRTVGKILENEFAATPSLRKCKMCDYNSICPYKYK